MTALHTELKDSSLEAFSPPIKYSLNEWYFSNRVAERCTLAQQSLADKILAECDRVKTLTDEVVLSNKREVDHKLEEKINDIEFLKGEIQKQRREVITEIENLDVFYDRLCDAIRNISEGPEMVSSKCYILREGRHKIDLCSDDVERELLKEIQLIGQVLGMLKSTAEQAREQTRLLRSTIYLMDRDLEAKSTSHQIDSKNLGLKETSMNLSMYHGFTDLNCSNITNEEWEIFTKKSIEDASKAINAGTQLRCYVDILLSQSAYDLKAQYNIVQAAFSRRISETVEAKMKLEVQHSEIVRQVNEMTLKITVLEKAISDKEGFMALSHTRLGNRSQRPGAELCRDLVETTLVDECRQIRENTALLQQTLAEAQASLRYLLKTQIQLEEEINIKANTLQIDQVDCMTMRETMNYHVY